MKWTFKLARIADIDVYIHYTFFLLLAWFAWRGYSLEGDFLAAADNVTFIVALFACVVLHEFGHALTARRFGVKTEHITLLPIGGVAAMQELPKEPKQEILIAIAGPMVNVLIAAVIWAYLHYSPSQFTQAQLDSGNWPFLYELLFVNVFLAVFNLVPAFPMDGGRVLRGILALKLNHAKATLWASRVGKFFAVLFIAYGFVSNNFILSLIGVFIFLGAAGENRLVQFRSKVKELPIIHVATPKFTLISWQQNLLDIKEKIEEKEQGIFPIGSTQGLEKLITKQQIADLLQATQEDKWVQISLSEAVEREHLMLDAIKTVDADMPINAVIDELSQKPYKLIAVAHQQRVVGIVTIQRLLQLAEM